MTDREILAVAMRWITWELFGRRPATLRELVGSEFVLRLPPELLADPQPRAALLAEGFPVGQHGATRLLLESELPVATVRPLREALPGLLDQVQRVNRLVEGTVLADGFGLRRDQIDHIRVLPVAATRALAGTPLRARPGAGTTQWTPSSWPTSRTATPNSGSPGSPS